MFHRTREPALTVIGQASIPMPRHRMEKAVASTERDRKILHLLAGGPKWGKDIAEHLGMTQWAQIAAGTMYGKALVKIGLADQKMMRAEPFGRDRAYFIITDAGRAALQQTLGA